MARYGRDTPKIQCPDCASSDPREKLVADCANNFHRRPVGRCIGCMHDFAAGPCGGCGAVDRPDSVISTATRGDGYTARVCGEQAPSGTAPTHSPGWAACDRPKGHAGPHTWALTRTWRVGAHYDIHVYEGDRPVATFHHPADAAACVAAFNQANAG
jgi:hypothetical protein